MARDPQGRVVAATISIPKPKLRLQILRGSQVLDEQELEDYSEVVIHTQPDKIRITPSVSRVVKLK